MARRSILIAALLAAFAPAPASASLTYTYMATTTDVNNNALSLGSHSAIYTVGGSVSMAIYLVETYTGTSTSLIAAQNGLFSSGFTVTRTGGPIGDVGATITSNNIEYVLGTKAKGDNTSTGPFEVNTVSGSIVAGQTGVQSTSLLSKISFGDANGAQFNNPSQSFADPGVAPNVPWTENSFVNNTTDGRNGSGFSSNNKIGAQDAASAKTAVSGRNVLFLGTVTFSGGSPGKTAFKILAGGSADPLTFGDSTGASGMFSLASDGVAGTTKGLNGATAPVSWTGTNNFAGFDITIAVVTPEPSGLLLGGVAALGVAIQTYRRRRAKIAAGGAGRSPSLSENSQS